MMRQARNTVLSDPAGASPISTCQFLVRCLREFLAAEGTPPSGTPLEEVDWNSFIHLAAFHRVAPLLDRALRNGCPQAVPASVLADLAAYVRSTASRSLFLTGELVRLLKHLEAQGIPAIPFKGPALAASLYGDPALRQFDDLDILVRQEHLPLAKTLLLSLGYQPLYRLTRRREKAYLRPNRAATFTLASGGARVAVDLHWGLTPKDFPFHPDLDGLWARCEPISLGGSTVAGLAPEDLLLVLCVHGSKHCWSRLEWVCDVARLVRVHPTMDWGRVMEEARASGGLRMLVLGLVLASDLLGTSVPQAIAAEGHPDPLTTRLAGQVRRRLLEGSPLRPESLPTMRFHWQLMARVQDRISYGFWGLRVLTSPTPADWTRVPLPDPLFPVYYALRPMRLAGKYGLRAAKHLYTRCHGAGTCPTSG